MFFSWGWKTKCPWRNPWGVSFVFSCLLVWEDPSLLKLLPSISGERSCNAQHHESFPCVKVVYFLSVTLFYVQLVTCWVGEAPGDASVFFFKSGFPVLFGNCVYSFAWSVSLSNMQFCLQMGFVSVMNTVREVTYCIPLFSQANHGLF